MVSSFVSAGLLLVCLLWFYCWFGEDARGCSCGKPIIVCMVHADVYLDEGPPPQMYCVLLFLLRMLL